MMWRAMLSLSLAVLMANVTVAAPSTNKVLILSTTITQGLPVLPGGSYEASAVLAAGLVPDVVTPQQWANKTAADFGSYRAIVLGDATCVSAVSFYSAAINNAALWLGQVTGTVIVMGTDPVYHTRSGRPDAAQWTINAVAVAVADPTKVGAYICLSCIYHGVPPMTPIPLLAPLGGFTARGVECFNNAHIVAVHPALAGLTDGILSNWGCSVHSAFDTFPSTFVPLAIARSVGGTGSISFADGSHGVPYILARGVIPVLCGDGILQVGEQCDNGVNNGVPGNVCSSTCRLHWCGDGVVDAPSEQCDLGAANGQITSGCSETCASTGPVCVPDCGSHGHCIFDSTVGGAGTRCACDGGWSGRDCMCSVPSYLLQTDRPPVLNVTRSGFKTKDELSLLVTVSSKYYDVRIHFKNGINATCNFPPSSPVNFWTPTYFGPERCEWELLGRVPWGVAWNNCLFLREETADYITFSGEMEVLMTEDWPEPIRGIMIPRQHQHALPFQVVFPKHVTVTSDAVAIYSSYVVQAGITAQIYDSSNPPSGQAHVRLYTSVQWPYYLKSPIGASSSNPALPITVDGPDASQSSLCPNGGEGVICQQFFDFVITPAASQCTLNADYVFSFMVGCHPDVPPGNCPLAGPSNAVPGTIEFSLQSSYFCQQIVANVDLSATLLPYATDDFTTPKFDYMLGLTGRYHMRAFSSQVSIVGTTLGRVTATAPNASSIVLYDATTGGNTAAGDWVSLQVTNGFGGLGAPATDCVFRLTYEPSFFDVPDDALSRWAFSALLNVVFFNTAPASLTHERTASVTPVHGRPASVTTVHGRPASVTTVHGRPASVTTVHGRPASVTTVHGRPLTALAQRMHAAALERMSPDERRAAEQQDLIQKMRQFGVMAIHNRLLAGGGLGVDSAGRNLEAGTSVVLMHHDGTDHTSAAPPRAVVGIVAAILAIVVATCALVL